MRTQHDGLFDLAAFAPDFWTRSETYEHNGAVELDRDFLSEDFCVIQGEHFFVRCVINLPILGENQNFGFGVWSTLSKANFEIYLKHFDEGGFDGIDPWTGWFSNRLLTFEDTLNQPCWVYPQENRQRPWIVMGNAEHELGRAQATGITTKRAIQIYKAYGHFTD